MIKHLYLHIPCCKYICSYCDFCKKYIQYFDLDKYLIYVEKELKLYSKKLILDTIYIGGGTPSTLSIAQLEKLRNILNKYVSYKDGYEFSFEANPDDITDEYCEALKTLGVNRLSLGIQSLNNDILHLLNREYDCNCVDRAITIASKYFNNINVDFMFNLPNQTQQDIDDCIAFVNNHKKITHISFYDLILEENTILYNQDYHYMSDDEQANLYIYIQNQLNEIGFTQYEISNWSRDIKTQSQHNLCYWNNEHYLGIGLGASGYLDDYRYTNTCSTNQYYQLLGNNKLPIVDDEKIDQQSLLEYELMLGLRTSYGVNLKHFPQLDIDQHYFLIEGSNIKIKPEFYFISNELIINLLEQMEEQCEE